MSYQQSRRERASSDRAQAVPPTARQRPGLGSRTASAPEGQLHKLGSERRLSSGMRVGHTLLEEDEGSAAAGHGASLPPRARRNGDGVSF